MQDFVIFHVQIPAVVAYLLLAVLGLLLTLLRTRHLLLLTLIALLLPGLRTPLGGVSRLLRWAFLGALVAQGLTRQLNRGMLPRPFSRVHRTVFALLALILVSASWSIGREITLLQGVAMAALFLGVFVVLWNSWRTEQDIVDLSSTLFMVAALLFTMEAVYLAFGLGAIMGAGRYTGVFTNPNGLGTSVAFLGPFVYWRHRTTESPNLRLLCRALGVVMVVSLFLSGSRSGLIGGVLCMGVVLSFVHRVRVLVLGAVLVIPFALLFAYGDNIDPAQIEHSRIVRVNTLSDVGDRLHLWANGLDLLKKRPWIGYGYGMSKFADVGRADATLAKAVYKLRGDNYHNTHLQTALDLGLVGLLLFWIYLAQITWRGFAIYRARPDSPAALASMAFFAAFLALSADSLVHSWAFSPGSSGSIVFWLVGAAVVRVHSFEFRPEEEPETEEHAAAGEPADWNPAAI